MLKLVYEGPGVYELLPTDEGLEWWRNYNGDPLFGLQVNSMAHAKTFAKVVLLWREARRLKELGNSEYERELAWCYADHTA